MVTQQAILKWLRRLCEVFNENRDYLTQLDSSIGDGDHGINMARGFEKVKEKLGGYETLSISAMLKDVGMTLVNNVGGSSGPLFGTWFLRASAIAGERTNLTPEAVVTLFEAGLSGVIQRGKTNLQDKTMVDALSPAVEALREAVSGGKSLAEALTCATQAAEQGMNGTTSMQARKGRASYLGQRSMGHQDPGATSAYLMIKAASETWT